MKRRLLRFGLTGLALAIGGFLLAASGIIPIKASSGHWPVTEWFLHFSMRRSIALHSLGIETPELEVPQLVLKGAGHYEVGCRPCHGSPGLPLPLIPRGMTPHPPDLRSRIAEMKPRELFYVVKHGVKFTGMPGLRRPSDVTTKSGRSWPSCESCRLWTRKGIAVWRTARCWRLGTARRLASSRDPNQFLARYWKTVRAVTGRAERAEATALFRVSPDRAASTWKTRCTPMPMGRATAASCNQ